MKKLRTILTILFLSLILGGMTSCEISRHSENGHRRGWSQRHDNDDHRKSAVIVIDKDRDHRSDDHDNH
jgi:hypothetical protein